MKEVFRLVDAGQDGPNTVALRAYNLEVYKGDIVVLFGLAGSGLDGLLNFINGNAGLSSGRIYIDEQLVPAQRSEDTLWKNIYVCGGINRQFENLTVAENLDILSQRFSVLRLFSRNSVNQRALRYLQSEDVRIDPEAKLHTLSFSNRLKLSLLQAKMAHASLVVIDCRKHIFGVEGGGEIDRMIRSLSAEGMAFLLISYRENLYRGLATRYQYVSHGADVMEWNALDEAAPNDASIHNKSDKSNITLGKNPTFAKNSHKIHSVLKEMNTGYGGEKSNFSILPRLKCGDGEIIIIPQESAYMLLENLSVEDNVILPIPVRVGKGVVRYIPKNVKRSAVEEFYHLTGISPMRKHIADMSLVERKILSIYRWEQSHPKLLILQNPYFGLDRIECRKLDCFIRELNERGTETVVI